MICVVPCGHSLVKLVMQEVQYISAPFRCFSNCGLSRFIGTNEQERTYSLQAKDWRHTGTFTCALLGFRLVRHHCAVHRVQLAAYLLLSYLRMLRIRTEVPNLRRSSRRSSACDCTRVPIIACLVTLSCLPCAFCFIPAYAKFGCACTYPKKQHR